MTNRDVRFILSTWGDSARRLKKLSKDIKDMQAEIENARDISGISYSSQPGPSGPGNPVESKFDKIEKLQDQFSKALDQMIKEAERINQIKNAVDDILARLPSQYSEVAEMRYRDGLSWLAISRRLYRSETGVRFIDRALCDEIRSLTLTDVFKE